MFVVCFVTLSGTDTKITRPYSFFNPFFTGIHTNLKRLARPDIIIPQDEKTAVESCFVLIYRIRQHGEARTMRLSDGKRARAEIDYQSRHIFTKEVNSQKSI